MLKDRCISMLKQGIIQEYMDYMKEGNTLSSFHGELLLPIGFKQIDTLLNKYTNIIKDTSSNLSEKHTSKQYII